MNIYCQLSLCLFTVSSCSLQQEIHLLAVIAVFVEHFISEDCVEENLLVTAN